MCTAAVMTENLRRWCATIGVSRASVGDTARYFNNGALRLRAEALGTSHHFAAASLPSTNYMVESMARGTVHTFKAILNEKRCPLAERAPGAGFTIGAQRCLS